MSSPSHADLEKPPAPARLAVTRPLYFSVRRELWENPSVYVAPMAVAAVFTLGFAVSTLGLRHRMRTFSELAPHKQHQMMVMPYNIAATVIILTGFLVAAFYCLEALHGERRDRSIWFWKSLPVSDWTTVLSKAAVPLFVVPIVSFCVSLTTQLVMLGLHSAMLVLVGAGAMTLWRELPLATMTVVMAYGLAVHALWHAPIYAWLLLVSAWSRRTPLLWAALPPFVLGALEKIVLRSSHFAAFVGYRLVGAMGVAFDLRGPKEADIERLSQLDPVSFLTTPGLWLGLLAAVACLGAAARLRRLRGPI